MAQVDSRFLSTTRPDIVRELDRKLLRKLNIDESDLKKSACFMKLWQACANGYEGLEFYAFNMVRTKDESDDKLPVKQFPEKPHLRQFLRDLYYDDSPQFYEKSRQIMMSWGVVVYATWLARFQKHRLIFFQSKTEEDAANLVYNKDMDVARASFVESHMPDFLYLGPGRVKKPLEGRYGNLFYPTGSRLWAIAQGGNKFRSYVARLVVMDEAAFMDDFPASYRAALAMSKNNSSQLVALSSANPGSYFGYCIGEVDEEDLIQRAA